MADCHDVQDEPLRCEGSYLAPLPQYALIGTYLLTYAAFGLILPFLPLVLHAKGLSNAQIAIAIGTSGVSSLVAPSICAHLADRLFSCRTLLPMLLTGNTLALLLIRQGSSFIEQTLAVFMLFSMLIPCLGTLDSFTLAFIKNYPNNKRAPTFQSMRIWGSIGFIAPAFVLMLVPGWHAHTATELISLAGIVSLVGAVCAAFLPSNTPQVIHHTPPIKLALRAALSPPLRKLFAANLVANFGIATFFIVFPRFLHELAFSTVEIGLVTNIGVIAEIALMPFMAGLVQYIGLARLIAIGFIAIPLRLFTLAVWPSQSVAIATQLLHGPLVIGMFIALPIYLQEHADNSFRHSLQNLNVTLSQGIARCIGPALAAVYLFLSVGSEIEKILTVFCAIGMCGVIATIIYTRP
jgi:MFS transporter, PPP family, 3-phenylpropionic acid transporter